MAIFISAGHHISDSGAIGVNKRQENLTTIEFRDLVTTVLKRKGVPFITDSDKETLREYLKRIKTGSGSVVVEFHFDSANGKASGCTALVGNDADRLDKSFARDLAGATSNILGVPNRGVKTEAESHRGRLGLMRENGIVCLLEICFIDNAKDMVSYDSNKTYLADTIADIIAKYENLL